MTEDPHRWLDAIGNRREYVREQMRGAAPVAVVSRPEGILLCGLGTGQSKVFEIYDRHALAALGHPVDIERIRQTAIEAAHLEGFHRSPRDVTLRRLVAFSLSPTLKTAFEQIYSPPVIAECVFAELGAAPADDHLVRMNFDGRFRAEAASALIAHTEPLSEREAEQWLRAALQPVDPLARVAEVCRRLLLTLADDGRFSAPDLAGPAPALPAGRVFEAALLDRAIPGPARYRALGSAA